MRARIDRMGEADLGAVLEIARAGFPHPWGRQEFLDELKREVARAHVARIEGSQIAGYAIWWMLGDEQELLTIATSAAVRRRGVASALMLAMLNEGARAGARRCFLEVRADNDEAIALYRRFGFVRFDVRRGYYPDGTDAWTMLRDGEADPATSL